MSEETSEIIQPRPLISASLASPLMVPLLFPLLSSPPPSPTPPPYIVTPGPLPPGTERPSSPSFQLRQLQTLSVPSALPPCSSPERREAVPCPPQHLRPEHP
ncbi:hypothetical protein LEMLEM_LOCUS27338 [Lemmus lemmus]